VASGAKAPGGRVVQEADKRTLQAKKKKKLFSELKNVSSY
jgi:hypothetical protein